MRSRLLACLVVVVTLAGCGVAEDSSNGSSTSSTWIQTSAASRGTFSAPRQL